MRPKRDSCRQRKAVCPDCGYTVRMTRSWMLRGFPQCPCGALMQPTAPEDLAYCGLIGPDDMSQGAWNDICRANGWEIMRNHGQAARARTELHVLAEHAGAAHCVYPGCGRWIASSADVCTAGHVQSVGSELELAAMPF